MLHRSFLVGWLIAVLVAGCANPAVQTPSRPIASNTTLAQTDVASTPRPATATAEVGRLTPVISSLARATVPAMPVASATSTAYTLPTADARLTAATATPTLPPVEATADATSGTARPDGTAPPALAPTPDGTERKVRVPILMYHYISVPPPAADVYRKDLSVTPQNFDKQLAYLQKAGYHAITLDDLLLALTQGQPLPDKPVILTFDDGYADNYANAFPLLKKYGLVGEFFLITDFINQGRPEYMNWQQIEEMAAAGQRFGSHSRDHPDLRGRPVDYLVWQALGGMEAIQQHLGYHPRWIAYPSGAYDDRTIAVYKSANYWGGLTTKQGATHTTSGLFELSRVRVRGSYTEQDLERVLTADW